MKKLKLLPPVLLLAALMCCIQSAQEPQKTQPTTEPTVTVRVTKTPEVYGEIGNVSKELADIEQLLKELDELENISFEMG